MVLGLANSATVLLVVGGGGENTELLFETSPNPPPESVGNTQIWKKLHGNLDAGLAEQTLDRQAF